MVDSEVERLRRLRGTALRLRGVARALARANRTSEEVLLNRGACAAWRVARAVSGRLRAHPFASYQKDAGLGVLVANDVTARLAVIGSRDRLRALKSFELQLKVLSRQLDDVRALAWASDLSENLGRSQVELRCLTAATEHALYGAARTPYGNPAAPASEATWPYLAL